MLRPNSGSLALARIQTENISGTLEHIKNTMIKFDSDIQRDPIFFNDILTTYIYTT